MQREFTYACLLAASLFVAGGLVAQNVPSPGSSPADQPAAAARAPRPGAAAAAALKAAAAITAEARGKEGEARQAVLRRAAEAHEAVTRDHAGDPGAVLRGWMEAGELWRRAGDLPRSRDAWTAALGLQQPAVAARVELALGDLERRLGDGEAARKHYRAVLTAAPGTARAHSAWLGIAAVHRAAKAAESELAVLREGLEATEDPGRFVELADRLAKVLVTTGALEDAAAAIAAAEQRASTVIQAGGKEAARLTKKLESMGARRALQRARDRAGARDVEDLDGAADRRDG